jgi:hypothetical protein
MEIKSLIEALDKRGLVFRSSYLREDGQVIAEINGVPMTSFESCGGSQVHPDPDAL